MELSLINAILNAGSIMAWVALFYVLLSKGNIVTRRENTLTLSLKDQIIREQAETIKQLREQNASLMEVTGLWKDFIAAARHSLAQRDGGE